MNGGNGKNTRGLLALLMLASLFVAPFSSMALGKARLRADGVVHDKPAVFYNTPAPTAVPETVLATPTVKPWLEDTKAPAPVRPETPTPTPQLTPIPWMLYARTAEPPTPSPIATPTATPSPSPTLAPTPSPRPRPMPSETPETTPEATEPPVEDTELSEKQVSSLLQNADLLEGEKPEDYLDLPGRIEKREGSLSVLLIGIDNHDMEKPGRSDSMILANVDLKTGAVKLVSFLRDMYVKIPGKGMNRLNAAYYYGGAELLQKTLETNFGVSVDGTLAVNFNITTDIIDQLGGITVAISEKERAQINRLSQEFYGNQGFEAVAAAGEQHLNGMQALFYSRIRKIDSDFQRTGRQHKVIAAMVERIRQSDAATILNLVTKNFSGVKTDMTLSDVSALLPLLFRVEHVTFESMHVPLDNAFHDDVVNGMMVLAPNLTKNSQAVAAFLADKP